MTRRRFCLIAAAGLPAARAVALAPAGTQRGERTESRRYFGGFRIGLQSSSLAKLPLDQLIAQLKRFELKYLELSPAHCDFAQASVSEVRQLNARLLDAGISTPSYGVISAEGKDQKRRFTRFFQRAQEFGIRTLVIATEKRAVPDVDQLATRYRVDAAMYNRAPSSLPGSASTDGRAASGASENQFSTPEGMLDGLKGRSDYCGAALDTGNLLTFGLDPVHAIELLKDRLLDVHLTDVSASGAACPLGTGKLDLGAFLQAIRKHEYDGPIMVKYLGEEGEPALAASIEYLKKITGGR